jgi:hypothetical protein
MRAGTNNRVMTLNELNAPNLPVLVLASPSSAHQERHGAESDGAIRGLVFVAAFYCLLILGVVAAWTLWRLLF